MYHSSALFVFRCNTLIIIPHFTSTFITAFLKVSFCSFSFLKEIFFLDIGTLVGTYSCISSISGICNTVV